MLKDPGARGLAVSLQRTGSIRAISRLTPRRPPALLLSLPTSFAVRVRGTDPIFRDVIKNNRSVLDMLYGNYNFVNRTLRSYGMSEIPEFQPPGEAALRRGRRTSARRTRLRTSVNADTWVRLDDAGKYDRGGFADGRVPDPEFSVYTSGEARLLGGPAFWAVIPPAPCSRTASGRGQIGCTLAALAQHRSIGVRRTCPVRHVWSGHDYGR